MGEKMDLTVEKWNRMKLRLQIEKCNGRKTRKDDGT